MALLSGGRTTAQGFAPQLNVTYYRRGQQTNGLPLPKAPTNPPNGWVYLGDYMWLSPTDNIYRSIDDMPWTEVGVNPDANPFNPAYNKYDPQHGVTAPPEVDAGPGVVERYLSAVLSPSAAAAATPERAALVAEDFGQKTGTIQTYVTPSIAAQMKLPRSRAMIVVALVLAAVGYYFFLRKR